MIHISTDDSDTSAYPQELLSLLCAQVLGAMLASKQIECSIHSDCQAALTQAMSRRLKQHHYPCYQLIIAVRAIATLPVPHSPTM